MPPDPTFERKARTLARTSTPGLSKKVWSSVATTASIRVLGTSLRSTGVRSRSPRRSITLPFASYSVVGPSRGRRSGATVPVYLALAAIFETPGPSATRHTPRTRPPRTTIERSRTNRCGKRMREAPGSHTEAGIFGHSARERPSIGGGEERRDAFHTEVRALERPLHRCDRVVRSHEDQHAPRHPLPRGCLDRRGVGRELEAIALGPDRERRVGVEPVGLVVDDDETLGRADQEVHV